MLEACFSFPENNDQRRTNCVPFDFPCLNDPMKAGVLSTKHAMALEPYQVVLFPKENAFAFPA